ncbi:hypothetical protein LEAN103870_10260 [Legionella anisa]|uniref:Uncharacterized protein n=1 Tax=Legionella anisa TaxID=28082 RepID=A0AAX0WVW5_9GAMM|nr:hypothetical protein [Legionella anisa]AWN73653.1 hypothetical protein DLD14_07275 [Legionella anisa]KTC75769.1 hypothetical protein Lani_0592 [Legionella anisa]MBN5935593.1 hypothetical protein [Legionella anisa]MCW8426546.1 hypothetical protein [Legionella anisa]MCW8448209.1 hypothetical protein [Legionella anisa]
MPENKTQPQQVPKLIDLTAEVIKKTNPHLFFTLYKNKVLPSQIEDEYVNPPIQALVKKHEHIYLANVKERKEVVNDRSSHIQGNCCFKNCASLAMTALGGGVHLAVYYILRTAGASDSTTLTFLSCIPATIIVSACFSPCATFLMAKGIAHCITSGVPKETVDLNEVIANEEEKRQMVFP